MLPSLLATPCNRFPRLRIVFIMTPSIHLVREGGVRELFEPVKGQLKKRSSSRSRTHPADTTRPTAPASRRHVRPHPASSHS
mmetsp:Transcript_19355/g.55511  ORF Transcript_19355/g.55511 Transcript_19355/m.55511 type:complete len:82 (-) Transcript_19355:902-1147(-)